MTVLTSSNYNLGFVYNQSLNLKL